MDVMTEIDVARLAGLTPIAESDQFAIYAVGGDTYLLVQRHAGTPWRGVRFSGDGVFRVGGLDGIEIIVVSNNAQATDLAQFTAWGIDPTRKQTVFVKSMHHFRAAFQPIAREVVLVDSGSLCSENYKPGVYKKVRHPIWPLDQVAMD